jgi:hypothetical protein
MRVQISAKQETPTDPTLQLVDYEKYGGIFSHVGVVACVGRVGLLALFPNRPVLFFRILYL